MSTSVTHLKQWESQPLFQAPGSGFDTMVMVEGQYTSTVYSLIKESRFSEAIDCLEPILEVRQHSSRL